MTRRGRLVMFVIAGAGLAAVLVTGFTGLPSFGHAHQLYGVIVNRTEPSLRRATDIVTALNFDLRAFDTLGEEFILFASILGVVLILREVRGEHEEPHQEETEEHQLGEASDAVRALALGLIPALITLGLYIVVHGQLTPGGGFQGGVILAAGPLGVFLAGRYLRMKIIAPHKLVESAEAIGAAGYGLVGMGGLIFAGIFFKNFLPFGMPGHLLSAGQMPLASIAVGLEVTGAFLVGWTEFLDQAMLIKGQERS